MEGIRLQSIVNLYEALKSNGKLENVNEDELVQNMIYRLEERVSSDITLYTDNQIIYAVKLAIDKGLTELLVEEKEGIFRISREVDVEDDIEITGEYIIR